MTNPSLPPIGNYQYDAGDREFLQQRIAQFRNQIDRRLNGELTEDEFKPLRLMNGLYLQIHAYMLRVAIPYGFLNARQMRVLAEVARRYDKNYGHLSTRQNIQFNWMKLENVADVLELLAQEDLHAIQTSGNCIRNVTSDHFAGAAADEIIDPRLYAEIIRQWSTLHPEFAFLPRKFKIAITGSPEDRVCAHFHDIGIMVHYDARNHPTYRILVGGGLGRTPYVGHTLFENIPQEDLIVYLEAILRVFNAYGRRDNKFKARIKILVNSLGINRFREEVQKNLDKMDFAKFRLNHEMIHAIKKRFNRPQLQAYPQAHNILQKACADDPAFAKWVQHNSFPHHHADYACVTLSCKPHGGIPGDLTSEQMDAIADLAEKYSFGEIRVSHRQNVVLGHVRKDLLHHLFKDLYASDLQTANIGTISDMISCPGLDYCSLANARSIPIAKELSSYFKKTGLEEEVGKIQLNISGCINACGHHHSSQIGILGVDKHGSEAYQITLGGQEGEHSQIGKILGPALSHEELLASLKRIIHFYLDERHNDEEHFDHVFSRIGIEKFKEVAYADT